MTAYLSTKVIDPIITKELATHERYTFERRSADETFIYIVKCDDIELGRIVLYPDVNGGTRRSYSFISIKRALRSYPPSKVPLEEREKKVEFNAIREAIEHQLDRKVFSKRWAKPNGATETTQTKKRGAGGRPRIADDDWAWAEVREKGRMPGDVYPKWRDRIGARADTLANPRDSFNKAISPKRKKRDETEKTE